MNKATLFVILTFFLSCQSKHENQNHYVYSSEELASEFIFKIKKGSSSYIESLDTFSDNIEQKDIVYSVTRKSDKLSAVVVTYNQRLKCSCEEQDVDKQFALHFESIKDFSKDCISSEIERLTFSGQKFLFGYCGNYAVLGTCLNNFYVRIFIERFNIKSAEDVKEIFGYNKLK